MSQMLMFFTFILYLIKGCFVIDNPRQVLYFFTFC